MREDLFVSRGGQNVGVKVFHVAHLNSISQHTWEGIELPADDLDSFVDMIETAKDCKGKPYHY